MEEDPMKKEVRVLVGGECSCRDAWPSSPPWLAFLGSEGDTGVRTSAEMPCHVPERRGRRQGRKWRWCGVGVVRKAGPVAVRDLRC